jgi:hypothetical protein
MKGNFSVNGVHLIKNKLCLKILIFCVTLSSLDRSFLQRTCVQILTREFNVKGKFVLLRQTHGLIACVGVEIWV